jgi:selenium-binding protein 1
VGPHGVYALPGRVLVPCLSNAKDKRGRTALVEYNNEGDYIITHWLPTKETSSLPGAEFADGYGYDARVLPRKNVLLTTSFTGWNNYTREFADLAKDAEAMKQVGNSMVLWNFHTRQPKKVFQVPGAPLEIRWALTKDTITRSRPRHLVQNSGSPMKTNAANGRLRTSRYRRRGRGAARGH